MVKIITCVLGLIFSQVVWASTQVTATLDKNPVIANESFVLTVMANDDVDTDALDTTSLTRDFIVGRTSVSSQTSMVNFKTSRTTKWTTVLIARTPGNYLIPALTIGNAKTQPINLRVLAPNDSRASTQQDLFITTDISTKDVYVQQQFTLTVKLHFSAELKRGSLTEPELIGASITQIGKDKENETIINGKRYRVIERTYAISPQKSGDYTLKSPVFSGEIMVPSSRRNSFLSFAETKPVSVIGDEIAISVKPIPTNYQGTWLPSELLTVHQEWQPNNNEFTVGEPITRVITLTAAGLSEEQLPDIDMPMPKGLKVYPDQAELHTGMNNNRLVSQKVKNFAIVANKAGTYQLPEVTIPWWNTVTNTMQYATIAAQTITVQPNSEQLTNEPVMLDGATDTKSVPAKPIIIQQNSWLQWLFLGLWLLTCLAWFISVKIKLTKSSSTTNNTSNNISDHYLALLAACKQNNSEQVFKHIVPWFNSLSSQNITTLSQVIQHSNAPDLIEALTELQQSRYGKSTQPWQGKDLVKAIQLYNKVVNEKASTNFSLNP